MGYTKVFGSMLDSSIWLEDSDTKVVWMTLLLMKDKNGFVRASVLGIAHRSMVNLEKVKAALKKFKEPDEYSTTKDNEGRRIEEVDGGFIILNHKKYRDLMSDEDRRDYQREYRADYRKAGREKSKEEESVNTCQQLSTPVNECQQVSIKSIHTDPDPDPDPDPNTDPDQKESQPEMPLCSGSPPSKEKVKSEFRAFTDGWCEAFEKKFGRKYAWVNAKDGSAASRLLKTEMTPDQILDIAQRAWSNLSGFIQEKSLGVASFAQFFNEICVKLDGVPGQQGNAQPKSRVTVMDLNHSIKSLDNAIDEHPANPESVNHDRLTTTPEQREHLRNLKARRKALDDKRTELLLASI